MKLGGQCGLVVWEESQKESGVNTIQVYIRMHDILKE